MKVYIVLNWFWEGDSYLVNSYEDCFSELNLALEHARNLAMTAPGIEDKKIYGIGDEIPKEAYGGYGAPNFYQIIEKTL
jgi:hypothetical protein